MCDQVVWLKCFCVYLDMVMSLKTESISNSNTRAKHCCGRECINQWWDNIQIIIYILYFPLYQNYGKNKIYFCWLRVDKSLVQIWSKPYGYQKPTDFNTLYFVECVYSSLRLYNYCTIIVQLLYKIDHLRPQYTGYHRGSTKLEPDFYLHVVRISVSRQLSQFSSRYILFDFWWNSYDSPVVACIASML